MSVMQDIYDSEVNVSVTTFWDGGYELGLGDKMNGFLATGNVHRWGDVESWFKQAMLDYYPGSLFALMYRDGLSRWQAEQKLKLAA